MKKNLPALFLLLAIAVGMGILLFSFEHTEQAPTSGLSIWISDTEIRAECDGDAMALSEPLPAALGGASVEANDAGSAVMIDYGDVSVQIVEAGEAVPASQATVLIFDGTGLSELPENPPEYAVIFGADAPEEAALRLLDGCCKTVCRVDLQGEITLFTDGQTVSLSAQWEAASEEIFSYRKGLSLQQLEISYTYVLNLNSKAFHLPSCPSVEQMKEKNRSFSSLTREELIAQGYHPCGSCQP